MGILLTCAWVLWVTAGTIYSTGAVHELIFPLRAYETKAECDRWAELNAEAPERPKDAGYASRHYTCVCQQALHLLAGHRGPADPEEVTQMDRFHEGAGSYGSALIQQAVLEDKDLERLREAVRNFMGHA